MDETTTKSNACMACACPCEMHTEHDHAVEGKKEAAVCEICDHEHKSDGTCDCGCK